MFNNKKIRFRILFGYSIPLLLFILTSAAVYLSLKSYEAVHRRTMQSLATFEKSSEMDIIAAKLQLYTRGYIIHMNDQSKNSYEETKIRYGVVSQFLKAIVTDEKQKALHEIIMVKTVRIIEICDELNSLVDKGRTAEAINEFRNRGLIKLDVEITRLNETFDERERLLLDTAHKDQETALGYISVSLIMGLILTLLFSIIAGVLITNGITRNVDEAINAVSSTAIEIASIARQHEQLALQQASMVNETTTSIQQLGSSSRQSSEQASSSTANTLKSLSATEEGALLVKQAIDGMNSLGDKVSVIAAQVLNLGEQTALIGNLANMVKDLAGEINMLALNAAVEAARAGEHGKGFAVVAGEVRKLANESKKSAEQANAIIKDIQKATNTTILRTEEGTKVVNEVTVLARNVGELFTTLSEGASSTYENAQQALLNAQQQALAIGHVVEAMNGLNTAARETAAGIVQTKTGIEQLKSAAMNLKQIV